MTLLTDRLPRAGEDATTRARTGGGGGAGSRSPQGGSSQATATAQTISFGSYFAARHAGALPRSACAVRERGADALTARREVESSHSNDEIPGKIARRERETGFIDLLEERGS